MSDKILELAYLRNRLFAHEFDEKDEELLQKIEERIIKRDSVFTKISINAINNCKADVGRGDFDAAAQEIQLIHNFYFDNFAAWNSDYFYTVELLSYLECVKDAKRIKRVIKLIGDL